MFYGQTSNWRKLVNEVTDHGHVSLPAIAAQYADNVNAIRVHAGQEAQVQMHVQVYLCNQDDFEVFEQFLKHFGLPQNGYQVVNTYQPYSYSASAALNGVVEQPQQLITGPSSNHRQP
jgi:hypothetical protein